MRIYKTIKTMIGSYIPLATSTAVLFIDASKKLAQDTTNLAWDAVNYILTATNINIATTTATQGQIKQNSATILHTYGTNNFFIGPNTGNYTNTGLRNTIIGDLSAQSMTTAEDNVGMGVNIYNDLTSGTRNGAFGYRALYNLTIGIGNVALGREALTTLVDGGGNMAIGADAIKLNVSADNNVGVGTQALNKVTLGDNVGIGRRSGYNSTTVRYSVFVGSGSGQNNTTGQENTCIGYLSNFNNQTGDGNTVIGFQAGRAAALHNKSYCVLIGYEAGYNETNSNRLYIANSNTSTPLIYGEFDNNKLTINGKHFIADIGDYERETLRYALAVA